LAPCNRRPSRKCIPCCRSLGSSCRSFCNRLACPPQRLPCKSPPSESRTGFSCNFSYVYFRSRKAFMPAKSSGPSELNTLWNSALYQERFEHRTIRDNHTRVVIAHSFILRGGIAALTLVAWFSISNHCASGALEGRRSVAVHVSCHGSAPAPTKTPTQDDQLPCCKVLRATLVTMAESFVGHDASMFGLRPYSVAPIAFSEPFLANVSFELDTGPPLARSFAESVLQRSILAHGPPFSLS